MSVSFSRKKKEKTKSVFFWCFSQAIIFKNNFRIFVRKTNKMCIDALDVIVASEIEHPKELNDTCFSVLAASPGSPAAECLARETQWFKDHNYVTLEKPGHFLAISPYKISSDPPVDFFGEEGKTSCLITQLSWWSPFWRPVLVVSLQATGSDWQQVLSQRIASSSFRSEKEKGGGVLIFGAPACPSSALSPEEWETPTGYPFANPKMWFVSPKKNSIGQVWNEMYSQMRPLSASGCTRGVLLNRAFSPAPLPYQLDPLSPPPQIPQ